MLSSSMKSSALSPHILKLLSYCPLCGRHNEGVDASLLGGSSQTQLIYVRGRRCAHALLAVVLTQGELVSSVGFVTDLSEEDVAKLARGQEVSIDDVLAVHAWVQDEGKVWKKLLT